MIKILYPEKISEKAALGVLYVLALPFLLILIPRHWWRERKQSARPEGRQTKSRTGLGH